MLRRKLTLSSTSVFVAIVGLALPAAVAIQNAYAETTQPTVAKILDDYLAATGGRAAYAKITSTESTATFTLKAQKITATVITRAKAPNKVYVSQEIAGFGKVEQGYDGKIGWARDPLHGLRTLAGKELEQMRAQAQFNAPLYWKDMFSRSQMLGVRMVNGSKAYAIRLTSASGVSSTQYFDVKSKLLVRMDQVVEQPEGSIPSESYLSDYRVVDGVKVPFTLRLVTASTGEATVTTNKLQNNIPLDDAIFAKPSEGSTPRSAK